jgi:hypothetical protein
MSDQVNAVPAVEAVAPVQPTAAEVLQSATTPEAENKQEAPKQDDKFASKFAALSRKEKAIQEMRQAIKREQEDWKSSPELKEFSEFKALRAEAKDPIKVLEKLGITYDDLTRSILGQTKEPTIEELAEKKAQEAISKLKEEMSEQEKSKAEKHYETVIENFKQEISQHIDANPDVYELTKTAEDPIGLIYDVIEEHYAQHKKVLSVKDAADLVEQHFEEKALSITKLKKMQEKLGIKPAEKVEEPAAKSPSTTLTNSVDTTTTAATTPRKMSREESIEAAARLIKFS